MSIGGNHLIWEKMLTAPLLLGRKKFKFCKHHPCHLFAKKPDFSLDFFLSKNLGKLCKKFCDLEGVGIYTERDTGEFSPIFLPVEYEFGQ